MTSLTNKLQAVRTALTAVTNKCYHYRHPEGVTDQFIVWQEDGEQDSFNADNRRQEQQIHGTVDYFTTKEFDATIDSIQTALDGVCGWRLQVVLYEDETNLIHYAWEFWTA